MRILLLSHSGDPYTTERVAAGLRSRGAEPLRLDTDRFPRELALEAVLGASGPRLLLDGQPLEVAAVWHWRLWAPELDPGRPREERDTILRESLTTLRGFLDLLGDRPWIDELDRVRAAENKTRQLRLAAAAGLAIPPTLITAQAAAVREFYRSHRAQGGSIVAKLQTSAGGSMAGGRGLPTRRIGERDLDALAGLRECPMVFQREIPKAWELRLAWVDGEAFVGALDGRRCGVDWRYESTATWEGHTLPPAVHRGLQRVMDGLGLRLGAIDLIVTPEGDYVFLEVNPIGEWGMLERELGLPIGAAIAEALLRLAGA